MIIIAVLGLLSILLIMNLQLSSDTLYTAKYLTAVQKQETAYYAASSAGRSISKYIGSYYSTDPKDLYDNMTVLNNLTLTTIDTGDVKIEIEIEDLERRFEINSINPDTDTDGYHLAQFKRLLDTIGVNSDSVGCVVDWIDSESSSYDGGGETSLMFESVKNAPIDSLKELEYIDNFNDALEEFKALKTEEAGSIDAYISASKCGISKINLNTAGRSVLKSLDENMSDEDVSAIIDNRPVKDDAEFKALINADIAQRIINRKLAAYVCEFFLIKVKASYDEEYILLTMVTDQSGNIKNWKVE